MHKFADIFNSGTHGRNPRKMSDSEQQFRFMAFVAASTKDKGQSLWRSDRTGKAVLGRLPRAAKCADELMVPKASE